MVWSFQALSLGLTLSKPPSVHQLRSSPTPIFTVSKKALDWSNPWPLVIERPTSPSPLSSPEVGWDWNLQSSNHLVFSVISLILKLAGVLPYISSSNSSVIERGSLQIKKRQPSYHSEYSEGFRISVPGTTPPGTKTEYVSYNTTWLNETLSVNCNLVKYIENNFIYYKVSHKCGFNKCS